MICFWIFGHKWKLSRRIDWKKTVRLCRKCGKLELLKKCRCGRNDHHWHGKGNK